MRLIKNLVLTVFFLVPMMAQGTAVAFDPLQEPCASNSSSEVCVEKNSQSGNNPIVELLGSITQIVAIFIGAVSVIMIMYGGFTYITSAGDSNSTTRARKIITWAIIGLVVAVSAFTITTLIINNFVVGVLFLL